MKAIRIHEFGGPDVLELEDIAIPQPADDEVLIKVYASSVNPVDQAIFSGKAQQKFPTQFPLIIGWDVSGVIEKTGNKYMILILATKFTAALSPQPTAPLPNIW